MKQHWYRELKTKTSDQSDKSILNPADSFNKVSQECIDMMHHFEGWRNEAYLDPVGVPTIGVGFIQGVKMGDQMTDEEIVIRLREELERFKSGVSSVVKVKITQSMFDALVSFSYNLGTNALYKSTLLTCLNQSQYREASDEFLKWVYAGGKRLRGLERRRDAERLMFLGDDWRKYNQH